MKKRVSVLLCLILIVGLTCSLFACATAAYWGEGDQKTDTSGQETNIAEVNPSAPYIVYVALDSSGNPIGSGSSSTISSYGVIGYTGTVQELKIPETYAGKTVTKVIAVDPWSAYKCYRNEAAYSGDEVPLVNNPFVKSISFGSNVTYVAPGVCAEMTALQSVYFDRAEGSVTCTNAFLGITPTITYKTA